VEKRYRSFEKSTKNQTRGLGDAFKKRCVLSVIERGFNGAFIPPKGPGG